jgi:hypothetical protein
VRREKLYHVEKHRRVWRIRAEGEVILEVHEDKAAAIAAAHTLAQRRGPARVIVHNHKNE